jgi:Subtilase family
MRSLLLSIAAVTFVAAAFAQEPAPERKIAPGARHAAASGRTYTRVNVVFRRDVALDDARSALLAAGGQLERPFATTFDLPRNLRARIPSTSLMTLAADARVFTIHGPTPRIANDNAVAAAVAHVDQLQAAPYKLDGQGVVLSYFELSPGDATHPEFGGRLTTHFPANASTSDTYHATHTAGTMIAAGLNAQARGMAPAATLHGYDACDDCDWLGDKQKQLTLIHSAADNNSWGYILGWCEASKGCPGWVWTENDEYIGAYDSTDSAIDEIARASGALMIHSAGNDGDNTGPTTAPFAHKHQDEFGRVITSETFCYSINGSGTDCPAPPVCSAGAVHCEIARHPVRTTVGSVGLTASSKNVLTVGASDAERGIASFSSRGPARDGRIKPDVTAKGVGTISTYPNSGYGALNGTSMAAPVVTGIAALLAQQWKTTFGATPGPVQLKALLIAGALDVGNAGPDYTNGFGSVDAKRSLDMILARRIVTDSVAQNGQVEIPLTLSTSADLRAVIVWSDPAPILLGDELDAPALVNDLDLVMQDAKGAQTFPYVLDRDHPFAVATRGINKVDNVEEVELKAAAPGKYRLIVHGSRITESSPQTFVLTATAGTIGDCIDATESNEPFVLGSGQSVSAQICPVSDVDSFMFHVARPGTLTITITSAETPLHAVLSGGGLGAIATDIAVGAPVPVTQAVVAGDYLLQISAGATGSYTVGATFPTVSLGRGRSARH